jgi:hypothetical protein
MWTREFWKATAERMIRGAAVAVGGAFFAGDWAFDALNVGTWQDVGALAIGGAFCSLVLALAGGAFGAGTGPSLTGHETTAG